MSKHLNRTLISALLIVTFLTPGVAQARPAAPLGNPAWDPTQQPAVASDSLLQAIKDAASIAERDPNPPTGAPTATTGRLLLSPAIDADGDPASNPQGSVPVARYGGALPDPASDVLYAAIGLAVEVQPDDPKHNPAGVIVTFRIWHETAPVKLVREARADAWGAAAMEQIFDDQHLAGRWFYQASAPGYGETPVRSFTFDASRFSSEVRMGAARITTRIEDNGRLVVDVESDVAIDESPTAVELTVVQLISTGDAMQKPERKMLPPMLARRIDEHIGRAELFLETGDYLLMAMIHSGNVTVQSEPALIRVAPTAPPPIAVVEAIYDPSPDGETWLTQYRTPDGDVALLRRHLDDLPAPAEPNEPPIFRDNRRIGAFQWQEDTYTVKTEVLTDDGKKRARLDGFSYDPLARRYEIEIQSLMLEPVEDKLTVQVFGPGEVLIYEETIPILLDPSEPVRHSVVIPTDLGEPQGLRIIVHDPSAFDWVIEEASSAINSFWGLIASDGQDPDGFTLTAGFKAGISIVSIDIMSFSILCNIRTGCSTDKAGVFFAEDWDTVFQTIYVGVRNYLRNIFHVESIEKALENLMSGLELGAGVITVTAGGRYTRTLYIPRYCEDPKNAAAAKEYVRILGQNLQSTAGLINQRFKQVRESLQAAPKPDVPFPGVWFLAFRYAPVLTFNLDAGASGDYAIYGELQGELGGQVVLILNALSYFDALVNLKEYRHMAYAYFAGLETMTTAAGVLASIGSASTFPNKTMRCRPPRPDGFPDDRRDAFQIGSLLEPTGSTGDVVYLQQQVANTQRLGLARAETYWTLRLRQAELVEFSRDPIQVINNRLEDETMFLDTELRIQGLISGTILPEPGQTITEAVRLAYDDFLLGAGNSSSAQQLQALQDAVDFAQRQYDALRGQELALQQELRIQLAEAGIGVVDSGLVNWALSALGSMGIEAMPVQILPGRSDSGLRNSRYLTPYEAPAVMLAPSGAFYRYGASQEARDWLDTYVSIGGTLIVLAQADTEDWDLLPGGEVEGLGYEQDILCKTASVRIVNSSPWIKGIGRDLPDIQIDGSFTAWPPDATVVLMRTTGNQMPAMIEYSYGAGHVVAMASYPDFYVNGMQSLEDIVFARSLFGLAYLQATGQSVAGVAAAPGAALSLSLPVRNSMAVTAHSVTLAHDYYDRHIGESWRWAAHRPRPLAGTTWVDLNPDLPSAASATVPLSFNAPSQAGIFRLGYFLGTAASSPYVPAAWYRSGGLRGPFYEVQSTYTPPPGLSVRANRDLYAFGELAEITVTVYNNQPTARIFELQALAGLTAAPVALSVGPNASNQHVFTTRVYERTTVRIGLAESGALLSEMPVTLRLSPPFLGLVTSTDDLPAGLAATVAATATLAVSPASQVDWEARLAGALVDSITTPLTPSGSYSLTAVTLTLPAAAAGEDVTISARLVGASDAMTQTLDVRAPYLLAGASLNGPLAIAGANSDAVRVQIEDTGFVGSGQAQALLRRTSDSAVVAAGPLHGFVLGSGDQEVNLDLPLTPPLDASHTYSVSVAVTGQVDGGAPINASRGLPLSPIDLDMALLNASRVVRQPLALRIFSPTGYAQVIPVAPFTVTLATTEGPPWSVSTVVTQTRPFNPLMLDLITPAVPAGGWYQVSLRSPSLPNWTATDALYIPAYRLHYLAPTAIDAGQPLIWTASNSGGVDTGLDGALMLLDDDGVKVAQAQVSGAIQVGSTMTVTLNTPQQLRSGSYRLRWSGVDHLGVPVPDERIVVVDGLHVALSSQTDQPAYFTGQTVTALSTITTSTALEDAQLRLRITSRGGNPYFGDYGEPGVIATTVAGGLRDGTAVGQALRLDRLTSISLDPSGNFALLADGRVIQRVDTATWTGQVAAGRTGISNTAVDSVGLNARFAADLMSVSLSGDGSFALVVEFGRGIIRRYDLATGAVSFVAGAGGPAGCVDGIGAAARFYFPNNSAVSHDGSFALVMDVCGLRRIDLTTGVVTTLTPGLTGSMAIGPDDDYALVAERDTHVVSRVTLPGGVRTILAGTAFNSGSADGVGSAARFKNPNGLAISPDETFALVSDTGNHTVRRVSLPGAVVTTLAGAVGQAGFADGVGSAARFDDPARLAIAPDTSFALVGDLDNKAVRRLDLATNDVTTPLGNWQGADGPGNVSRFEYPTDVAVSPDGSFALVPDNGNATVRRIDLTTGAVTTLAGAYDQYGTVDGVGAAARFYYPAGVAISPDGSIALVVDDAHDVVRKIDLATLEVTTVAGAANQSGYVDGVGAAARFDTPLDVIFSPDGSYALIADTFNSAIRKLDLATAAVTTFVAPGTAGMNDPRAIDFNSDGSFALIAGTTDYVIYRVDISGGLATAVIVLAGNGYRDVVDGVGTEAGFDWPQGIAISPDDSVALVTERFPHVVRRIDLASNAVTTVAGAVWEDDTMRDGSGSAARIYEPQGIDFSPDGSYALAAVTLGNAVVRLDLATVPKAQVQTVVNRSPDTDGQGPEARLYNLSAVALSSDGSFAVIADSGNNAIRFLDLTSPERAEAIAAMSGTAAAAAPSATRPDGALASAAREADSARSRPARAERPATPRAPRPTAPRPTAPSIDLPPAYLSTLAGQSGTWGSSNGVGNAAHFNWPEGIALSPDDSFALVSDTGNHTIRRVDLATTAVTTLAGSPGQTGSADGTGSAARFNFPTGLAIDPGGSFALIADTWNHTIRQLDIASGAVMTLAGQAGSNGSADGVGSAARFSSPRGVAISADGSFALVADENNGTIRRIDLATNTVTTLAGQAGVWGSDDGIGNAATFGSPSGVSISADGSSAVVVDSGTYLARHIDLATGMVTTLAGEPEMFGYFDGAGNAARFSYPLGVALSPNGDWALVADYDASTVRYVDVISREVATLISLPLHEDGSGHDVRLNWPYGLDLSADGSTALLVDNYSSTIRRYDPASGELTTTAGDATDWPGSADGVGAAARFRYPGGGALDAAGTIAYIADSGNHTIRRVDLLSGAVTTIAGSAGNPGSANGAGSAARFRSPHSLALSPDETFLLVADGNNHTIRRVDLATYQVTTVAGSAGVSGNVDGVSGAARLNQPSGIAISPDGSYALIGDTYNHMVRRLDLINGWVTRLAGWPGWNSSLDGFLDSAYFSYPRGIAISADGAYALVSDSGSGLVRRIGLAGPDAYVVTTLAGVPWVYGGADGIGSAARFYWPIDVALSDDTTFALALDGEGMTVRRLGLPGTGTTPATLLRQEWQPVDGARTANAIDLSLPFIDPNLLEDGRARGQLYLEADLWSRDPTSSPFPAQRHRLASASYAFVVEDAHDGLALFSGQPTVRHNVTGYTPDDDASTVHLLGMVRNTTSGVTPVTVTVTRSDGATVLDQSFADVPPDQSRDFRVDDPAPPLGPVSYTATTSLGHSETVTMTIVPITVDAQASVAPSAIALGEPATLRIDLLNQGTADAFITAGLATGPLDLRLEPGQGISLTQVMTPTQAGQPSLSLPLSGDVSGPISASIDVRNETAQAELRLVGVVRSTRLAGPQVVPQLVQSGDAAVAIGLTNAQPYSFDVVVDYTLSGPETFTGSQALTLDPGASEVMASLGAAPAGSYSATFTVRHARLGNVIAALGLDLELVAPQYDLALEAELTPLEDSQAVRIDVTARSASSDLPWHGSLRWSGAIDGEQHLDLNPNASQTTSATVPLEDRAGEQTVVVALIAPDGSVDASQTLAIQAAPRAAPAAILDDVTVNPAVAGGALTVVATVGNDGPAGEVVLEVTAFDQVVEQIGQVAGAAGLRGPTASSVLSVTVPVPPDLLAGIYPVNVRLGQQERRLDAQVTGAEMDLRQWLNADVYQPEAQATWTVELEGLTGAPAQYDVELRYGDQAHVQTVTLGAGQTVQVPWTFEVGTISDRGTVMVQTHPLTAEQTRYSLIVDSIWLPVVEDSRAWLETDQGRYNAGETIHLTYHLETPVQSAMVMEPDGLMDASGPQLWSSLQVSPTAALTYTVTITDPVSGNPLQQMVVLTGTNWLEGDFSFDYTLPATVATGRYFFRYFFGGEERTLPVDVFGVELRVESFKVSGPGSGMREAGWWEAGDTVTVEAMLRLDAPVASAQLTAWVLGPGEEYLSLGPTATITQPLPAGLSTVTLHGLLDAAQPGAHQVVLSVRDSATLVELGGDAAFLDVGRASISSLLTDQGTYSLNDIGRGELTVYGIGPTQVVVTATNGSTLLDTVTTLDGFDSISFPIPTANMGDYLLVARTVDSAGNQDNALRAYAVPLPLDTEPPVLALTYPSTHTVLYSNAPTMTLTLQGQVSDNRGPVQVYVNGHSATVLAEAAFSALVELRRGANAVSVVALDDAGNYMTAPVISIIVTPQSGVTLTPDRINATVGQDLMYETILTSTGTISNAQFVQFLPPGRTSGVTAHASSGSITGIAQGAEGIYVNWRGDVDNTAPVSIAVTVTLSSAGPLTSTATAFWGWGLDDQADSPEVNVTSPLAVLVGSFSVTQAGNQALLAWETISEMDHLGFNVYRGPSGGGPWSRVNDELIPSLSPGSTAGHAYELLDPTALPPAVTWYRLEAIDVRGTASEVGLASIEQGTLDRRLWLPVIIQRGP